MKLTIFPETFDCYSFASFETLVQQKVMEPSFVCSVSGDYSLIVTSDSTVTEFDKVEAGWRCIAIDDEMSFDLTGIAASITTSLAGADISVLVMSGYKTDYFLIKAEFVDKAAACLKDAGHEFPP